MKIEIPKILENIQDERYFEIRDVDSKGCGSFNTICISADTPDEEIYQIVADEQTNEMIHKEEMYIPSVFREPPKWRQTIKVVEQKRNIKKLDRIDERTGRDYINKWNTKKGGLKFTINNNWIRMKMTSGEVREGNGYSFGKLI